MPPRLREYLQKSYLELFELAPKLDFTTAEIEAQRTALKSGRDMCLERFENHAKRYGKQIDAARNDLKKKTATLTAAERKEAHCSIQNLDLLKSEAEVLAKQVIPTAYDNLSAKLDVIKLWPAEYQQIQQESASGSYHTRRWGDVNDIGFRQIEPNHQDDIKRGAQALEQMKRLGLMPPAVEDKEIQEYVRLVAERVAKHSDLKIPPTSKCFNLAKSMRLRCLAGTSLSSVGCLKPPTMSPNMPASAQKTVCLVGRVDYRTYRSEKLRKELHASQVDCDDRAKRWGALLIASEENGLNTGVEFCTPSPPEPQKEKRPSRAPRLDFSWSRHDVDRGN